MEIFKLTDQNMQTYDGFQWELGKTYEASGKGDLCGSGWLHAYEHPLLAILHNPIHAGIENPRLFRGVAEGKILRDGQMKLRAQWVTLLEEIPLPQITLEQKITYGIYVAQSVIGDLCPVWSEWAEKWLSGEDRSAGAAETATKVATDSAETLAVPTDTMWFSASSAAWFARATQHAACAAADATETNKKLNLIDCVERACGIRVVPHRR